MKKSKIVMIALAAILAISLGGNVFLYSQLQAVQKIVAESTAKLDTQATEIKTLTELSEKQTEEIKALTELTEKQATEKPATPPTTSKPDEKTATPPTTSEQSDGAVPNVSGPAVRPDPGFELPEGGEIDDGVTGDAPIMGDTDTSGLVGIS